MLDKADVILSLDADFLSGITHPGFVKLCAGVCERRKLMEPVDRDEPALRGREHADHDRLQGGPPAEAQGKSVGPMPAIAAAAGAGFAPEAPPTGPASSRTLLPLWQAI